MSRLYERLVRQVDDQLVDGPAAAPLQNVDAHQVAPDRPDAAGYRTQGARADPAPTPGG